MVPVRARHIVQYATPHILNLSVIQSPDSGLCYQQKPELPAHLRHLPFSAEETTYTI